MLSSSCYSNESYLTVILQNFAEYCLILSRRGRRPSWLNSGETNKIEQDNCFIIQHCDIVNKAHFYCRKAGDDLYFTIFRPDTRNYVYHRISVDGQIELLSGQCYNVLNSNSSISFFRCWSSVGRQYWMTGVGQLLSLGPGCNHKGTIMHEMMHAVGFWHEQSRPDRNLYVEVLWENIQEGTCELNK